MVLACFGPVWPQNAIKILSKRPRRPFENGAGARQEDAELLHLQPGVRGGEEHAGAQQPVAVEHLGGGLGAVDRLVVVERLHLDLGRHSDLYVELEGGRHKVHRRGRGVLT